MNDKNRRKSIDFEMDGTQLLGIVGIRTEYSHPCSHRKVLEYIHELRVIMRVSVREQSHWRSEKLEWWHVDIGEASILNVVARERNSPELRIGP
jgi:hypothetical protein